MIRIDLAAVAAVFVLAIVSGVDGWAAPLPPEQLRVELPKVRKPLPTPLSEGGKPGFKLRGTKGWNWSPEQYLEEVPVLARYKMNFLMNCYTSLFTGRQPGHWKNEWWLPLSDAQKEGYAKVIRACREQGVNFCFAVHPQFCSPRPMNPSSAEDFEKLWQHYEWAQGQGVKWFCLPLDDVAAKTDQFVCVNKLFERLRAKDPECQLIFCPSEYWGTGGSAYLATLAKELHPDIYCFWTGPQVVSRYITRKQAVDYRNSVKHRLIIWDNYPVNDGAPTLHLGPVTGRDPDLGEVCDGYMANPLCPQNQINRIPLLTEADYAYNPRAYDPRRSIGQAIAHLADTEEQRQVLKDLVETYPGMIILGNQNTGDNPVRRQFSGMIRDAATRDAAILFAAKYAGLAARFDKAFPDRYPATKRTLRNDVEWMQGQLPAVRLPRPTPEQAAWQDLELGMFIHYDIPVFKPGWGHRQYETRPEASVFNPKKLNTDQWMEAAKAMGAKYAVFVAKHGSGFMCWQSDLYPYGMKQSPYKDGQGDIVRDFVNSCRTYGIRPGIYAHMGCNGYLEVDNPGLVNRGKGGDPEKQARYAKICEGMLTELWGNYGELFEIWFDGGVLDPTKGGPVMLPILHKLQPKAIVFQGPAASIRWIGNEDGVAPYPCWATVPDVRDYNGPGSPEGQKWLPGECDVPIRQGVWLWEPNTEDRLFSVDQLMDKYYRSVGQNCNLLLNANPDPDGLIPEADMKRYKEFGDEIRRRFVQSIAETTGNGELVELALGKPTRIDHVITMENVLEGERVREYVIEGLVGDQWQELCRGTSIGHKKIDQFSPTEVSKVRWRCLKSVAEPRIRRLAVYAVRGPDNAGQIDQATLDAWSAPYRGWHYYAEPIIPSDLKIPGYEKFHSFDVPTVYQIPGQPGKWFMSYIGFNGQGYNSFVSESTNLVQWTNPRLAMGFGKEGEFDFGGCVVGAYLYESYDIKAPRLLKKRDGKFWTLYGCYPKQGGYEIDPGYEGVAGSVDGLTWKRAKEQYILSVHEPEVGDWEKDCIYQPWLVEHEGRFYNFYNAKRNGVEQMGGSTSTNLLDWERYAANPIVRVRPGGYDEKLCSDGKVFRDGDHWVMFYFGVGKGGAHIMAAFSRDLRHWTAHPEPLYKAGGHPGGLDRQYAHKISLVHNPANDTFYLYYCAVGKEGTVGNKGRCIGLLTSRKLPLNHE